MTTVREINDPRELAGYRPLWKALLAQTEGASFFHSLDWLQTYWTHFSRGCRLRVLIVSRGPRVVGILPLMVRTERRRIGTVRVLTYPLDHWGSFYGPIGPHPRATLLAGLGHVRGTARDWDFIELPWVDATGSDQGRTRSAMKHAGLDVLHERWQPSAMVDLTAEGGWHAYWASRTSRWRNNVRRSEKKLAKHGDVTYVRYRPSGVADGQADPRWDWYDQCERIARASWQGGSDSGTTLTHETIRPFLRDCHRVAAAAGALDLNMLLVDEEPVAFNYAYHYNGYVFGLRTGYDAVAGAEGAGSVLQARMIEDCFSRGDRTYDLGPDYLECKRYWATETRYSYRYTHFPSRVPLAQLVRAKRGIQRWLCGPRA